MVFVGLPGWRFFSFLVLHVTVKSFFLEEFLCVWWQLASGNFIDSFFCMVMTNEWSTGFSSLFLAVWKIGLTAQSEIKFFFF